MVIMKQFTRGIRGRFIVCEEIREERCSTQAEEVPYDVSADMLDPARCPQWTEVLQGE